jgi:Ala-tRNA(Pro) deacylase
MTPEQAALMARLDALGIRTRTVRHPPLFTVAESKALRGELPGGHSKNLFLKDKKGILWLIVAGEDRAIDLKALRPRIGSAPLSFASPERLHQVLGVEPGSVTPFALINDRKVQVRVVLDAELLALSPLNFHPLVNTATTAIAADDLLVFVRSCGHEPRIETLSPDPGGELEQTGARRHV